MRTEKTLICEIRMLRPYSRLRYQAQCMRGGCTWNITGKRVSDVRNAFSEHDLDWHEEGKS